MRGRFSSTTRLSAFPNFTPRTPQFGSRDCFGFLWWTITPTKLLHPGAFFLTASAIVNSSSAGVICARRSLRHHVCLEGSVCLDGSVRLEGSVCLEDLVCLLEGSVASGAIIAGLT